MSYVNIPVQGMDFFGIKIDLLYLPIIAAVLQCQWERIFSDSILQTIGVLMLAGMHAQSHWVVQILMYAALTSRQQVRDFDNSRE